MPALQKNPAVFKRIEGDGLKTPVDFNLNLNDATVTIDGTLLFGGFRITAPRNVRELDFVWYFSAPNSWTHWYICPAKGKAQDGFETWLDGDKVYQTLDNLQEKQRSRVLQTLSGANLRPGEEYILWFRKVESSGDHALRGRFRFVSKKKTWDYDSIEKVLELKPMGPEAQVQNLRSRGGKMLLDAAFFDRKYAASRIDHVFFSLRHTKRLKGGFFITTEIACPALFEWAVLRQTP